MKKSLGKTAWPSLLHRVVRTVRSRNLFQPGQHLLVAVSGGADSIALLSLLDCLRSSWSLTLTAVHCNYGLRGSESDDDQEFARARCKERNIPLHVRRFQLHDSPRYSSLQAVARDLRYRAFNEIAEECGADRIAVGHTADDQAETVLLWLLRGSGLTGLSGMPAFRDDKVIRPLYEASRREISTYLRKAGISFREDSSNAKPLYLRNRIRQEIVPNLNRLVPSSTDALCRLADICREDDRYLEQQATALSSSTVKWESAGGWVIDRGVLLDLPSALQRRIIRGLLRQNHAQHRSSGLRTIDRVIRLVSKRGRVSSLDVARGRIIVGRDEVRFISLKTQVIAPDRQGHVIPPERLTVPGTLVWPSTGQQLQVQRVARDQVPAPLGKYRIVVDADRVSQPLLVRPWSPGDRFHPSGMKGHSKKLQDFFTDLKIPVAARSRIPVVAAPEGIVWIVGYRQDQRWMPTATTERCLVLTVDGLS